MTTASDIEKLQNQINGHEKECAARNAAQTAFNEYQKEINERFMSKQDEHDRRINRLAWIISGLVVITEAASKLLPF